MRITVKFSNLLKIYSHVDQERLEVPEGITLKRFSEILVRKYPSLPVDRNQIFFTVNAKIARDDGLLCDEDVVGIYQAVSGG